MTTPIAAGFVMLVVVAACTSGARDGHVADASDAAGAPTDAGGDGGRLPDAGVPDDRGYAIVGLDIYPPLLSRVRAVPCGASAGSACTADSDCGAGQACICAGLLLTPHNVCAPAECRSSEDCATGLCLLSLGALPDAGCETAAKPGLYCKRAASTCQHGGDCPGNGNACVYIASRDRFECGAFTCSP
jgi:hypothetical protein